LARESVGLRGAITPSNLVEDSNLDTHLPTVNPPLGEACYACICLKNKIRQEKQDLKIEVFWPPGFIANLMCERTNLRLKSFSSKKYMMSRALLFLLPLVVFLTGCRDVLQGCGRCKNGICSDKVCQCEIDWFGEDCDLLPQTWFAGTYSASVACTGSTEYEITIVANPSVESQVTVSNIHNLGDDVVAVYQDGQNMFEIPSQVVSGKSYVGSLYIDETGNVIELSYFISTIPSPCTGTLLRK
jgi:hypothetical protein